MLTPDEIRRAIVQRTQSVLSTGNSYHNNHHRGIIRGLAWVLTSVDCPVPDDVGELFARVGITDEWLRANGFAELLEEGETDEQPA